MLFIDKVLISEGFQEPLGRVFVTTACHTKKDRKKFGTKTNNFQICGDHHQVFQFHQYFTQAFCTNIFAPENYKAKM